MSKSMWCDAINTKPIQAPDSHKFSEHVLFWVEGENVPKWGYYNHAADVWADSKYREVYPSNKVHYFAYISNPYT